MTKQELIAKYIKVISHLERNGSHALAAYYKKRLKRLMNSKK